MTTVRMSSLPNDVYWRERAAMRQEIYNRADNRMLQQLDQAYEDAQVEIKAEMQRLIAKYARRTGMSIPDAAAILREPAPQAELNRLRDLAAALDDSPAKRSINARLNAESVRFRVNNLRAMQENAHITVAKLGQKELELGTRTLKQVGREAYMRTAFDLQHGSQIGWNASGISEKRLTQMLQEKWTGVSYSDRLWNNTELLAEKVSREITSGMMGGRDRERIIRDLMQQFDVSRYVAARLVVTETAYVANKAELQSYIDGGVEEYQFVATFDERTSDVCREHGSKVYKVADAKPGSNFPPLHPWCRSTTIPVYGLDWLATVQRSIKDKDGKMVLIPATWDYNTWSRWQEAGCPPVQQWIEAQEPDPDQSSLAKIAEDRKADLRDHPEKALPGAESATAPDGKFTDYLFNPENREGWAKGIAFNRSLGYNISNWKSLQSKLIQAAREYPAQYVRSNGYGELYEQLVVLRGANGRLANAKVGWINEDGQTHMTTAFIEKVRKP